MKKILMITTGGTIACKLGKNGLVPSISGEEIINYIPNLKTICHINMIEIMNIDSSNISSIHYKILLNTLEDNYNLYDGFVITHGTDTMAYTSSFLHNACINLNKPIVLTGSQLPIQEKNTDAIKNIYDAFLTALSNMEGVFLVFNSVIHFGYCVKKVYSLEFTGFLSINNQVAGKIVNNNIIWVTKPKDYTEKVIFNKNICDKIFVLTIIPTVTSDIINTLINLGYKGIIIEGYGAGGVPCDDNNNFIPALKYAIDKGVAIVCNTQCLYNGVHLDKYPMGILATKYGAISAKNMTLENTIAKLMLGLGNNMDLKTLKQYIEN